MIPIAAGTRGIITTIIVTRTFTSAGMWTGIIPTRLRDMIATVTASIHTAITSIATGTTSIANSGRDFHATSGNVQRTPLG